MGSNAVTYVARHGQTEWNLEKRWQGQLDSALTPAGWRAAEDLARFAVELRIDAIFASPLGRAQDTAAVVADTLGIEVATLADLAEMHHGAMAGMTAGEADATFPGLRASREQDKYRWRFPEGESYADVDERAARAVEVVRRSGRLCPLVVSHEMIGRMLVRQLAGLRPEQMLGRRQPHNLVYAIGRPTREVTELSTG